MGSTKAEERQVSRRTSVSLFDQFRVPASLLLEFVPPLRSGLQPLVPLAFLGFQSSRLLFLRITLAEAGEVFAVSIIC